MAGWFRDEGLVSDADPNVSAGRERRQPALPADGDRAPRRFGRTRLVLLDLWGKLDRPGAVFADITWVGYTGRAVPERFAQRVRGHPRRARRRRRRWCSRRCAPAGSCAAGKSTAPRRRCCATPATAITSCTAPATASASRCTATASTWTTTKRTTIGGCSPGTGFTIEPGVYFDDFGVRTEINMIVVRARRGGHRAAADRDSGCATP